VLYVLPSDELWPEPELLELDFPLLPAFPDPLEPDFPDPLEPAFPDPLDPAFPDPMDPAFPDPLEPELSFPNLLAPSPSVFVSALLVLQDMSERSIFLGDI
jgi:hypothetical protein